MRPVAKAVIRAGLVPPDVLAQMKKWGVLDAEEVKVDQILDTPEQIVAHIQEALESKAQVEICESDLDILQRYLSKEHQQEGRLHLRDGERRELVKVNFCLTKMGEYAIPWLDEENPQLLANGESFLRHREEGEEKSKDVYFVDIRELYFGDRKAFIVCVPMEYPDGNDS